MTLPDALFASAIKLEKDPKTRRDAMRVYQRVIDAQPDHAGAHINLATLHYQARDFENAEIHYRLALTVDPEYALAWYDIGNVFDETGRLHDALEAYARAIKLAPTYADAHYNLALLYEKLKQ